MTIWNLIKHVYFLHRIRQWAIVDAGLGVANPEGAVTRFAGPEIVLSDREIRTWAETVNKARVEIEEFTADKRDLEDRLTEHNARGVWTLLVVVAAVVEVWASVKTLLDLGHGWFNATALGVSLTLATVLFSGMVAADADDPVEAARTRGRRLLGRLGFLFVVGCLVLARVLLVPAPDEDSSTLLDLANSGILSITTLAPPFIIHWAVKHLAASRQDEARLALTNRNLGGAQARRDGAVNEQRGRERAVADRLALRQLVRAEYTIAHQRATAVRRPQNTLNR